MKTLQSLIVFGFMLLVSIALGGLAGGCRTPTDPAPAPKPGRGIAEYRAVTRDAHRAVAATVKSLEAPAIASPASIPASALAGFDRTFLELESTSFRARARAEAIVNRGQAYFDEWREHLSTSTNSPAATAERERYTRLLDHFNRVRQRSGEVRGEFGPFMARLREFRAALDRSPTAESSAALQSQRKTLIAGGRQVLQTLESVSTALDEAEVELHAVSAAKR